jgi:hypothetical protein
LSNKGNNEIKEIVNTLGSNTEIEGTNYNNICDKEVQESNIKFISVNSVTNSEKIR